jgi:hypothetical protein
MGNASWFHLDTPKTGGGLSGDLGLVHDRPDAVQYWRMECCDPAGHHSGRWNLSMALYASLSRRNRFFRFGLAPKTVSSYEEVSTAILVRRILFNVNWGGRRDARRYNSEGRAGTHRCRDFFDGSVHRHSIESVDLAEFTRNVMCWRACSPPSTTPKIPAGRRPPPALTQGSGGARDRECARRCSCQW